MRALAIVLVLSGCKQLLGFDDVGTPADAPIEIDAIPDAGPCLEIGSTCVGDTLRTCTVLGEIPTDSACSWGCLVAPAHCGRIEPAGGALVASDLVPDSVLADITISVPTTINSDSGVIAGVRVGGTGVISGIDFTIRGGVGIFRFKSLLISAVVIASGGNALVLAATGDIVVDGLLDARGDCLLTPGPGGFPGGDEVIGNGGGPGGGGEGNGGSINNGGGGGGGHGAVGGTGGATSQLDRGVPGGAFGIAEIPKLAESGGSGGGTGGANSNGGFGGGGGGAVQLVSNTRVRILSPGINAGGCNGKHGPTTSGAGGGGGAGGTILIEAPTIEIGGGLAVNGGGGGGGSNGNDGVLGTLSIGGASGGTPGLNGGRGGDGGASSLPGTAGLDANHGGGGGGAVGRIRINTRTGAATFTGVTSFTSPPVDGVPTTATQGIAVIK